jgi:hypothetical protein
MSGRLDLSDTLAVWNDLTQGDAAAAVLETCLTMSVTPEKTKRLKLRAACQLLLFFGGCVHLLGHTYMCTT